MSDYSFLFPMQKKILVPVVLVGVCAAGGVGAYVYFSRPVKAPNLPPMQQGMDGGPPAQGQQNRPPQQALKEPTELTTQQAPDLVDGQSMYAIQKDGSKATFSLQEDLRGERITVLGETDWVFGDIAVDRQNLSAAKIGTIQINARTLKTDSAQRNGAIARLILKSEDDANEWIVFKPTAVNNLPMKADIGQEIPVEISGDLTVSGVTKPVTFAGSFTFTSDAELKGKAQAKIHYPDFGIAVPNLPFLANVEQDTTLSVDFVAQAK